MLIVFDCDGVLVDSEPIAARVTAGFLRELNYPAQNIPHDRFVGLRLDSMRRILETETGVPLPDDFEEDLLRRDAIAFKTALEPISGVHEIMPALGFPRCVASSGSQKKIRNALSLTGLLSYFEPHLFSAQDPEIENGKPAPDLFLLAARKMGAVPKDCVVVEDTVPGVEAGVAAGMRVLGFTGGGHCGPEHGGKLFDAGADQVFDNMLNLMDML